MLLEDVDQVTTIQFEENCEEDQGISNFVRPGGGEDVGGKDRLQKLGRVCDVVVAAHGEHPPLDIVDGVVKVMPAVVVSSTLLENVVEFASDGRLSWRHGLGRPRSSGAFDRERGLRGAANRYRSARRGGQESRGNSLRN